MMTSISEVLETMFFMSLEYETDQPLDTFLGSAQGQLMRCQIDYSGKVSGYFELFMPDKVLFDMTGSFMGLENDQVNAPHLEGTLKESLNMIAGSTFTHFDSQAVFKLGIPEIIDPEVNKKSALSPGQERIFIRIKTTDGDAGMDMVYQS
jgi:hypothetical protein